MKITVLNGSPKGDMSVTLQSVHFIRKTFPAHEFQICNISSKIRNIENNADSFLKVVEGIGASDAVLWAFPLYFFLVPAQYKRFVELVFERGAQGAFRGKYAAALSTSWKFFDHSAHNYIHAICDDLEMRYAGFFSMAMYDLLETRERQRLGLFAETLFEAFETKTTPAKAYLPLPRRDYRYMPGAATEKIDNRGKKVLLLADSLTGPRNLAAMIERFSSAFIRRPDIVDLDAIDMKSGCQGCIQCGYDNECCQDDGFTAFFKRKAVGADIIVFAGSVKDRFLSSAWKTYLDRSFFMNHTPALRGKQFGLLFSGPLSRMENLREILSAYAEWQGMNPVDFVSDEPEDHARIDQALQALAQRLVRYSRKHYTRPSTFLGVGGMKIFRDAIWGSHRFVFQADHRYFKSHGLYDFPHKNLRTVLANAAMMLLTKVPAFRGMLFKKMIRPKMVEPHKKVLKKLFEDSQK